MERGVGEISWVSLWRILGMLVLASILYVALDLWVGILLAIIISSALDPLVSWLEKRGIPRVVGALGIFIALFLILALVLYTIVPIAVSQLTILLKTFHQTAGPAFNFQEVFQSLSALNANLEQLAAVLLGGNISFFDTISTLLGSLTIFLSVFMLTFYLTIDRDGVENFLRATLPSGYEDRILDVYFRTRKKIGRWLYGQVFLSLSVGVAVFMGLWFIGVKYSLLLAVLAAILEIVPFVGPVVTGLLSFLIALPQSLSTAIFVVLMFTLIQQIEGALLTPVFMRFATSVHPAMVLASLLIGGRVLGIIGVVIAVPVAVALQEIAENWTQEKLRRRGLGV